MYHKTAPLCTRRHLLVGIEHRNGAVESHGIVELILEHVEIVETIRITAPVTSINCVCAAVDRYRTSVCLQKGIYNLGWHMRLNLLG